MNNTCEHIQSQLCGHYTGTYCEKQHTAEPENYITKIRSITFSCEPAIFQLLFVLEPLFVPAIKYLFLVATRVLN